MTGLEGFPIPWSLSKLGQVHTEGLEEYSPCERSRTVERAALEKRGEEKSIIARVYSV